MIQLAADDLMRPASTIRYRSEVVEYRVEQYKKTLAKRLEALQSSS